MDKSTFKSTFKSKSGDFENTEVGQKPWDSYKKSNMYVNHILHCQNIFLERKVRGCKKTQLFCICVKLILVFETTV